MEFWVGQWMHCAPDEKYDANGRRNIIKHMCWGPLETQIWFETSDHKYYYEEHIIEGILEGDKTLEAISKIEMIKAINDEIILCKKYSASKLIPLFENEREKIENNNYI